MNMLFPCVKRGALNEACQACPQRAPNPIEARERPPSSNEREASLRPEIKSVVFDLFCNRDSLKNSLKQEINYIKSRFRG